MNLWCGAGCLSGGMSCHGGATCKPKGPACTHPAVSDRESPDGGSCRNGSQGKVITLDTCQFPGRRIEAQPCQQVVIFSWVGMHGLLGSVPRLTQENSPPGLDSTRHVPTWDADHITMQSVQPDCRTSLSLIRAHAHPPNNYFILATPQIVRFP